MPTPPGTTLRVGAITQLRRLPLPSLLGFLVGMGIASPAHAAETATLPASAVLYFDSLATFTRPAPGPDAENSRVSPWIASPIPWTELIASWNVRSNVALHVEARARLGDHVTRFYDLGSWAVVTNHVATRVNRSSVRDQSDTDAEVQTDTLVLKAPATRFQIRLTFLQGLPGPDDFRYLGVSLAGPPTRGSEAPPTKPSTHAAPLDVPVRSQAEYPEGISQWCSPTSLTMVLAHHARTLHRPELEFAVPDVARAVFDPGWPGTGNWSFNVAFAGAQPGIRAYVARLENLAAIEPWIARKVPIIASVSYAMLKGRPQPERGDGHLVVVTGFDDAGDVVINDPGVRRERVRRTFARVDFERAWAHSRNTVYLIHPETIPPLGMPAVAAPEP